MRLKIETPWAAQLLVAFFLGGEHRPRVDGDGRPKVAPNGRPTFQSGAVVVRPEGGQDRSVTIAVTEPGKYPVGQPLRLDGEVWVTPYESNGRVAYSFICDRLVPLAVGKEGA